MKKLPTSIPGFQHRFLSLDHTSLFAFSKTFRLGLGGKVAAETSRGVPIAEIVVQARELSSDRFTALTNLGDLIPERISRAGATDAHALGSSDQKEKSMPQQILQVNLTFSIPRTELETAWLDAAQPIADTPGLLWKVWLMNEAEHEAGGIYLFENEAAVQSYLGGPMVAALKASPVVSNISAKVFDVLAYHSAVTRAPLNYAFESAG